MTLRRICLLLLLPYIFHACNPSEPDIMAKIAVLQEKGAFTRAEELIKTFIDTNRALDSLTMRNLNFELERNKRIRLDYNLNEEDLFNHLQKRLDNVSKDEFDRWQNAGWFDMLIIDGEKRFVGPSVSNLLFRHPELTQRQKNYNPYSNLARVIQAHVKQLTELAAVNPDPVLFPRTSRVRQTLTVNAGEVPDGETVRCWLPYPSVFEIQGAVKFTTANHKPLWIGAPASPIRSVFFEDRMPVEKSLEFAVEYEYTAYAFYQQVDTAYVQPFDESANIYRFYTREEYPHGVFSDEISQLSRTITAQEQNPYLKGKRIYEWIADNIAYSYAREYSTLRNISAYCLENRYGDCGQEAILFITLCRTAGIPARWQSGFMTFPGDEGMHDWAEIYIRPYGWLPVDPYMGIFFTSVTEDLDPETRRGLRDFYYGNIDHFRLVANKGHNQTLYPEKMHVRSETVDFQRGEVEWSGDNLYFNQWKWSIDITDVTKK